MNSTIIPQQHQMVWSKLNAFCESGKIPHILFHGSSGTGKKTLVQLFIHKLYQNNIQPTDQTQPPSVLNRGEDQEDDQKKGEKKEKEELKPISLDKLRRNVMWVNCAQRKGIKFIREDLKFFAQTNVSADVPFKIIVLHNADYLTNDAQSALRRCMEQYSQTTRFIGIVQNKRRLLFPILSRFCEIFVPTDPTTPNLHQLKIKSQFADLHFGIDVNQTISDTIAHAPLATVSEVMAQVDSLYDKGITSIDVLQWIRNNPNYSKEMRAFIGIRTNTERIEFRNEKLFMFHVLQQLTTIG
jgi:hypothetical protein